MTTLIAPPQRNTLQGRLWGSRGAGYSSTRDDWTTPKPTFDKLHTEFDFTLDAAATDDNALLPTYFTPAADALAQPWHGRVFLNPPYGRTIGHWLEKAMTECRAGRAETVVCLVPARTDTRWWHDCVMRADEVRLIRGRLKFGGASSAAPFPSAVVVFHGRKRSRLPKFEAVTY
jgi:phage N-6-adenine-methyltransferase